MKRVGGVAAATAAGLLVLGGCGVVPQDGGSSNDTSATSSMVDVVFEVEGEEAYNVDQRGMSADITLATTAGTEQQQGVDVPLTMKGGAVGYTKSLAAGSVVSFSAQISSDESGTVTCRITSEGRVVAEKTSKGKYAVVSCSGRV